MGEKVASVFADLANLDFMSTLLLQRENDSSAQKFLILRTVDQAHVSTYYFLGCITQSLFTSFVPQRDVAIEVGGDDRVVNLVQDLRVAPQFLLDHLLAGDIEINAVHPVWLVMLVKEDLPTSTDPPDLAGVGPHDSPFRIEFTRHQ